MGDGVEMMKAGVPTLDLAAVFTWFPVGDPKFQARACRIQRW